jgi:hypothetical protein
VLQLLSTSESTPTRKTSHKPRQLVPTVGLTRLDYVRSMVFQLTRKFLPRSRWVLGSLLFITDKFRDLSLQEPESLYVTGSSTDHIPMIPAQVSLVITAQLRHGSNESGEAGSDTSGDKADHHESGFPATTDPICKSPSVTPTFFQE